MQVPLALLLVQVVGACTTDSSTSPSQSSSLPSHVSVAGVLAEQPSHPEFELHVSMPKQVPAAPCFWQVRVAPLLPGRHEQVPDFGTHWLGPPEKAEHWKPTSQVPAAVPCALPAEQSSPQSLAPFSVMQRRPPATSA